MHAWQSWLAGLPTARAIDSTGRYRSESAPTLAGNGAGRPGADRDGGGGRSALLRIYVDQVDAARPKIEAILDRDAKRWSLEQVIAGTDGPPRLTYRVRPRKSVGLDGVREHLLREAAPHVVAADAPDS